MTAALDELLEGKPRHTLLGHTSQVYAVAFSPDGTRLASAGGFDHTVRIWDTDRGQELLTIRGPQFWAMTAAFSQDGEQLATGTWNTSARILDARPGRHDRTR